MADWQAWWNDVVAGLDSGAAPGGAAWVAVGDEVVCHAAHGHATLEPEPVPLELGHRFDLASVTKAIATTSCVMALVEDEAVALDASAAAYLPELADHGKVDLTVRELLTHTSGLPAWVHFYDTCANRAEVRAAVLSTPLESQPGEECRYSDVGFLTLGFLVEAVAGRREDVYLRERVLARLGFDALGYGPIPAEQAVATELCKVRRRLVRGEVHDENAWTCGGVAGHAGLFGTVEAVGRFGLAMLRGEVFAPGTAAEMFRERQDVAAERFWLGWKRLQYDSGDGTAFGHDGFTGTLLWVCPARELVVGLLTNRVHPTRDNRRIYDLRPGWIAAAAELARG